MSWSEAFAELVLLVQPDVDPILTKGDGTTVDLTKELDSILANSVRGVTWSAGQTYAYGQTVFPTVRNGHRYKVTTPGTSGSSEPSWGTGDYSSVTLGTAIAEEDGMDFQSIYDVRRAAYECWNLKAAKASDRVSLSADGQSAQEQQVFEHCERMVKRYASVGVA